MSDEVLQVRNLTKIYHQHTAVDGISFALKKGEVLGLLGPNGAGKTTTIQMLLSLTTPDSGSIKFFGHDLSQDRAACLQKINFASAYSKMQGKLTVYQNLRVYAGLYQIKNPNPKIAAALDLLEISHQANTIFWHLSSGQQTRAILARALLNDPQIILMDEPTASLDPEIINKMIDLIRDLQQQKQISILYTSHNMEEVTRLCDRVLFLQNGRIVADDTPSNLTKMVGHSRLQVKIKTGKKEAQKYLQALSYSSRFTSADVVEISLPEEEIPAVLFGFQKYGVFVNHIKIKTPTLEDVFLLIAQRQHGQSKSS